MDSIHLSERESDTSPLHDLSMQKGPRQAASFIYGSDVIRFFPFHPAVFHLPIPHHHRTWLTALRSLPYGPRLDCLATTLNLVKTGVFGLKLAELERLFLGLHLPLPDEQCAAHCGDPPFFPLFTAWPGSLTSISRKSLQLTVRNQFSPPLWNTIFNGVMHELGVWIIDGGLCAADGRKFPTCSTCPQ